MKPNKIRNIQNREPLSSVRIKLNEALDRTNEMFNLLYAIGSISNDPDTDPTSESTIPTSLFVEQRINQIISNLDEQLENGKEIELEATTDLIRWRYVGETNWTPLVSINSLRGEDGRNIELQQTDTHVQWRYQDSPAWTNLIPLEDIRGPQGTGINVKDRLSSVNDLFSLQNVQSGDAYAIGDFLYLYNGQSWETIEGLVGPAGEQGPQGEQGPTGSVGPPLNFRGKLDDPLLLPETPEEQENGDFYVINSEVWLSNGSAFENTGPVGPQGEQGPRGNSFQVDAVNSEETPRTLYDTRSEGFTFYDPDTGLIYQKRSDTLGDWSEGIQWRGPEGPKGNRGIPGYGLDIRAVDIEGNLDNYITEEVGFAVYDYQQQLVFIKSNPTGSNWVSTTLTQGPKGEQGPQGEQGEPAQNPLLRTRYVTSTNLILEGLDGNQESWRSLSPNLLTIPSLSVQDHGPEGEFRRLLYTTPRTPTVTLSNNIRGPRGLQGVTGDKGDQGEGLEIDFTGTSSETGSLATGSIGTTFYGTDTKTLYIKTSTANDWSETEFRQGPQGDDGVNGLSIQYNWNNTQLGIRQEGESTYQYVDLKGEHGDGLQIDAVGTSTERPQYDSGSVGFTFYDTGLKQLFIKGESGGEWYETEFREGPKGDVGPQGNRGLTGDPGPRLYMRLEPGTGLNRKIEYRVEGENTWTSVGSNIIAVPQLQFETLTPSTEKFQDHRLQYRISGAGTTSWQTISPNLVGPQGPRGWSLQYDWDGTRLGIKPENSGSFQYTDLQGQQGEVGQGLRIDAAGPFSERSDYDSQPEPFTFFDTTNDNLYIRDNTEVTGSWSELPGYQGPQGPRGLIGEGLRIDIARPLVDRSNYDSEPEPFVFFDTTNNDLYVRNDVAVDGWTLLPGYQGPQGEQGPSGSIGPSGSRGPAGLDGVDGQDGVSLEYNWTGTSLGIRRDDQGSFEYVNLKGDSQFFNYRGQWSNGAFYAQGDYVIDQSSWDVTQDSLWFLDNDQNSFESTISPRFDTNNWVEFRAERGPQGNQGPTGPPGPGLSHEGNWEPNRVYDRYDHVFAPSSFAPLTANSIWIAEVTHTSGLPPHQTSGFWNEIVLSRAELEGIPSGGSTGQVLAKRTVDDRDLEWITVPSQSDLDGKVDKVLNKGLSTEDFTTTLKEKLDGLEGSKFKGTFVSLNSLQLAEPSPDAGAYANVDQGVGSEVVRYIWDEDDTVWVEQSGASTQLTATQIKTEYESNPDTNAFTDVFKTRLENLDQVDNTSDLDKPISTAQQDEFDRLDSEKLDVASTQETQFPVTFTSESVYGTQTTPMSSDVTVNLTDSKLGVTIVILHNAVTTPIFPGSFRKMSDTPSYQPNVLNVIHVQYINDNLQIYSITQLDL